MRVQRKTDSKGRNPIKKEAKIVKMPRKEWVLQSEMIEKMWMRKWRRSCSDLRYYIDSTPLPLLLQFPFCRHFCL